MGIPKKALRYRDLTFKTHGSVVSDSSHQTSRVSFIYDNGQRVDAFYKKLDKNYPPLLAKISVATSILKRLFQGERSAEERLVFDDQDNLIGTVSIGLKDFKSFLFEGEEKPSDPLIKAQVIPNTQTLIDEDTIALLFGRWFLNDDDAHPHNLSLKGDIDFDMFFYWFTILIKKPRAFVGIPNSCVNLSVADWETFPIVTNSKPFHWPTYERPGKETLKISVPLGEAILTSALPKRYPEPDEFKNLAASEKAHEQKFIAALKALLTFDPDMVKNRLRLYFGDLTLDFMGLEDNLPAQYRDAFPKLCTDKTNTMPFVDFMVDKMYQQHYDNLYRVVVLYSGCTNNSHGVHLTPTYEALYRKPSYYKDIIKWVIEQNETLYSKEGPETQYNLQALEKRYHKIWRDSFAISFKELWEGAFNLTNMVVGIATNNKSIGKITEDKKPTDNDVTETKQLFSQITILSKEKIKPLIALDPQHSILKALDLLIDFTNLLGKGILEYYGKNRETLSKEDNNDFSTLLRDLNHKYIRDIKMHLAYTTTPCEPWNVISEKLKHLMDQVDFPIHLGFNEHIRTKSSGSIQQEALTLNDEKLKYCKCLFEWVKNLKSEDFSDRVIKIIDKHYSPFFSYLNYTRFRADPVKNYLKNSTTVSNDNRLAYILSSGESDTGELNNLLILHLTPDMLRDQNLPSIQATVTGQTFKDHYKCYVPLAVNYAKTNPNLVHHFSTKGTQLVFETLFNWVDSLSPTQFKGLIDSSMTEYTGGLWTGGRIKEVSEIRTKNAGQQAKIVALIFSGKKDGSTLNDTLFCKIIHTIKSQILEDFKNYSKASAEEKKKYDKYRNPGYRLIKDFNEEEHKSFYIEMLGANTVTAKVAQKQENACLFSTI